MAWIGKTLAERYTIERQLGQGGMGSVYLARDERLGRPVVVKVPHEDLLADAQFRQRFLSEVRGLARLEHLHVIKIHDAGEHEGVPYAVAQYVDGGDLRDRLPPGTTLAPEDVLAWARPIADALDFLHGRNHVHRDVKPGNILFDQRDNAYLSDFGIATVMQQAEHGGGHQLTRIGAFVGSPVYSPPEALDRHLTPQYDQYSLGVVLFEALSGTFPFDGATATQVMGAKVRGTPAPLTRAAPGVPPACADAVMRALARRPEERFETCTALVGAFAAGVRSGTRASRPARRPSDVSTRGRLRPAAAPGGPGAPDAADREGRPAGGAPAAAASARRRRGLAAGTLALAGVAALAGWLATRGPGGADAGGAPRAAGAGEVRAAGTAPIRFTGGVTPDQLSRGLALCEGDCRPELFASEGQRGPVAIGPLAMGRTEVTSAAFARFAEATGHVTDAERRGGSTHGLRSAPGHTWRAPEGPGTSWRDAPRRPVVHVSALDAEAYCAHHGRRLPSEDEWEFFARGGDGRLFPWGDDFRPAAVVRAGSDPGGLPPVGSRPAGAGPRGHLDLAGSVWEWTSTDGLQGRILKGGSWLESNPAHLRTTVQLELEPRASAADVGFRCVEPVEAWPAVRASREREGDTRDGT